MALFRRRVLANLFSKWRQGDYIKVIDSTNHIQKTQSDLIVKHLEFKDAYKGHNSKRSELILDSQLMRNTLGAWKNIAKYLKMQRETTKLCMMESRQTDIINALTKWRLKAKITKERRKSTIKTL